jgi:hypothetical protein
MEGVRGGDRKRQHREQLSIKFERLIAKSSYEELKRMLREKAQ